MNRLSTADQIADDDLDAMIIEIRGHMRRWGGYASIQKYGRDWVLAAMIPED